MTTYHLSVKGRVQGVGYRASLMHMAIRLGLRGWVRNRIDGSVEAVIDGPQADCDALVAWARRGPPAATVASVVVTPADESEATVANRFEQRPTI